VAVHLDKFASDNRSRAPAHGPLPVGGRLLQDDRFRGPAGLHAGLRQDFKAAHACWI